MARRGTRVLIIVVAVVAGLTALWIVAGAVRVPMTFDAEGITSVQLNGGTMTLVEGSTRSLRASVPLRAVPVLMARKSDTLLEAGGFDDADPRVLIAMFSPPGSVPASIEDVEWELGVDDLERITVAGGRLEAEGLRGDSLVLFGVAGDAVLRDIEFSSLAVHAQAPARITVAGRVGTFSIMDTDRTVDVTGLEYDEYDRDLIIRAIGP